MASPCSFLAQRTEDQIMWRPKILTKCVCACCLYSGDDTQPTAYERADVGEANIYITIILYILVDNDNVTIKIFFGHLNV